MKGRKPHVYQKESVRWPRSEGVGKVTRISREVREIQMLMKYIRNLLMQIR